MSAHAGHAEALRRVLVAEGDASREFESTDLAGCAQCARAVAEHRRVLGELAALARDERAALESARRAAPAPGRAEAALRAHVLGARASEPPLPERAAPRPASRGVRADRGRVRSRSPRPRR
jgi:hypothetical protein